MVKNQNNNSSSFLETNTYLVWKVWTDRSASESRESAAHSGKTANVLQGS